MDYIIDPMLIYWISVISSLGVLFAKIAAVSVCVILVSAVTYVMNYDIHYRDRLENKALKIAPKCIKISIVTFIISMVAVVFIPTQQTMYAMLIANTLTRQNIQGATDFTQDQIGKIIDKVADASIRISKGASSDDS